MRRTISLAKNFWNWFYKLKYKHRARCNPLHKHIHFSNVCNVPYDLPAKLVAVWVKSVFIRTSSIAPSWTKKPRNKNDGKRHNIMELVHKKIKTTHMCIRSVNQKYGGIDEKSHEKLQSINAKNGDRKRIRITQVLRMSVCGKKLSKSFVFYAWWWRCWQSIWVIVTA